MNPRFEEVGKAAKTITGKSGTLYFAMVSFATDPSFVGLDHEKLKEAIKGQEKEVNVAMRMKIGDNSTYRVVKGIMIAAREYGISLLRTDGKPKGKTEVEQELKDAKGSKSPADKFKATINTATLIEAKLETADLPVAAGIVQDLYDKLVKRIADLPSQA